MKSKWWILSGILLIALLGGGFLTQRKTTSSKSVVIDRCGSTFNKELIHDLDTTRTMAPKVKGLGDYGMTVSCKLPEALQYFNQGFNLYYGFNHLEAYRSFREATRLDPNFAMAYWGQALSLGPNINSTMDPADAATVVTAIEKAKSLAGGVSEREKVLIDALVVRYINPAPADRSSLDKSYAEAMRVAATRFPTDTDIITLTAEALMDLNPWNYWLKNGTPQPWTLEIVGLLEKTISIDKIHPGANHLMIHIYEASANPEKAMASAELLQDLIPGSGHLVHMPSHIYIRTGRYNDGVVMNEKAIKADEDYIEACKAEGVYPLVYYPHNIHFLWAMATLDGRGQMAIAAADRLAAKQDPKLVRDPAWNTLQHYVVTPMYARVRFGKWNEILNMPNSFEGLKYPEGIWRYARCVALARLNRVNEASAELNKLKTITSDAALNNEKIWGINSVLNILRIAEKVAEGELEASRKNYKKSIVLLTQAVALEDALIYQEPYDWHHPVRQVLGGVCLEAGKPAEAEKWFREDLKMFAGNGWALTGLKQSLEKQGKKTEAIQIGQELEKAFARADVKLIRSRF